MLKTAFIAVVSVLALTSLASEAYAPKEVTSAPTIMQTVKGEVFFERRSTITPMSMCGLEPCRRSQTYWGLSLRGENSRYEVKQMFALGSPTAPEKVELAGIEITPGTQIEIEGEVTEISEGYAIVSEVTHVSVISHPEPIEILPVVYNWMCQSPDGSAPKLYIHVRYQLNQPQDDTYYMNIAMARSADDVSFYPIAEIADARLAADETRLSYQGETRNPSNNIGAQLIIEKAQNEKQSNLDLPSALVLTGESKLMGDADASAENRIYPVTCTRTRGHN